MCNQNVHKSIQKKTKQNNCNSETSDGKALDHFTMYTCSCRLFRLTQNKHEMLTKSLGNDSVVCRNVPNSPTDFVSILFVVNHFNNIL